MRHILSRVGFVLPRIVRSTTPRRRRQALGTSLRKVVRDTGSVCRRVNHNRRISVIVFYIQRIFRSGNLIGCIFLVGRIVRQFVELAVSTQLLDLPGCRFETRGFNTEIPAIYDSYF